MNNQNQTGTVSMVAPESGSLVDRKERSEITLITPGVHIARLYGIVDLGTQLNHMFNTKNRKIALLFEFLHLRQSFYKDNSRIQPAMIKVEETWSMNSKANFFKLVSGALGRRFTEEEAKVFDISSCLGKYFLATVIHEPSKKNPANIYERISGLQPYDERFIMAGVDYTPFNEDVLYHIPSHGFSGDSWRHIWGYLRKEIIQSEEGQAHAANGGVFEEVKFDDNGKVIDPGSQPQMNAYGGAPAPNGGMQQGPPTNVPSQPVQQPMGNAPVQGLQPVQQSQAPVQQPMGNAPVQGLQPVQQLAQQVGQAPVAQQTQKQFKILREPTDLKVWLDKGWTQEMMVEKGHAQWVDSPL